MRALFVMLGAVAMLVSLAMQPANAQKGTDFDRFIKRVGKFAIAGSVSPKPKGLCVCQDGGGDHTSVGVLVYDGQPGDDYVTVRCWVRGFYSDGRIAIASPCDTFEVLSK